MTKVSAVLLVFVAIGLTTYAQIAFRAQIGLMAPLPMTWNERIYFLINAMTSPLVISAIIASLMVSICWVFVMTKLPLNMAYPMMSLTYPAVIFAAYLVFDESIDLLKIAGLLLIMGGIVVMNLNGS